MKFQHKSFLEVKLDDETTTTGTHGVNNLISDDTFILDGLGINVEGLGGRYNGIDDRGEVGGKNLGHKLMNPTYEINQSNLI